MTDPTSASSRRFFLQVSAAAAGGLLVGCRALPGDGDAAAPTAATNAAPMPAAPTGPGQFGIYVEITPDNVVHIVTPQSEMGQGVHDGMPKLIADELDADWARVEVRMPWTDDRFFSPVTKRHRTAQSDSTTGYFATLRQVGAATREMLVAAAAARWQVPADECTTANSAIAHGPTNRTLTYGEVAAAAAALPVPATPRLKAPVDFKLIGTSTLRKDTPPKCDGSAIFGIDVRRPNMLYAALRFSPAVRTRFVSFDRGAALKLPGVVDAFPVGDAVAVVARSTWQAMKAAETLDAKFDDSSSAGADTEALRKRLLAALDNDEAALPGFPYTRKTPLDKAKTLEAIKAAPVRKEWTYEVPYLAHAALEPLTATAQVTGDAIQVWAPSQHPDGTRNMLAQLTGLPKDKCRMDVTFVGGGFGRKWELDFVRQAAQIAMKMKGTPVKLTWTREQDFRHDFYRPAHAVRTRVGLGRDGAVLGIHSRITGISMWKNQGRPLPPGRGDIYALGLLINDRYDVANPYTDFVETPEPIPVGTWRSVSLSMNGFFAEAAMDDIAASLGEDPLKLRQRLLANDRRSLAALNLAAEKAGWGKPLPRGRGRGIAFTSGFDSYCAQVVEVTVKGKAVKVDRIVCAFDCGLMVDPHNVEAQVEGGIVWGLSAALSGQMQFADGAVANATFADAPILRINEMPKIEVHLMRSDHKPGGAGEASVPPVAPALAQAIFAATGRRPRRLPITASGFTLA